MTRNSAKAGLSGRLTGLMLVCLLATATAFSQTANNGMILGSVTDNTGAVIPDVTVTLSNELSGGQRSVVTDQQGVYHLLAIPAGTYGIKFEKPGFNIFESQHISLSAGDSLQLNAALAVSSLQQTVSVEGGVLNRVDTTSANLQNTISSVQLSNTPLSTRSWTQMMGLEPGVSSNEQIGRAHV